MKEKADNNYRFFEHDAVCSLCTSNHSIHLFFCLFAEFAVVQQFFVFFLNSNKLSSLVFCVLISSLDFWFGSVYKFQTKQTSTMFSFHQFTTFFFFITLFVYVFYFNVYCSIYSIFGVLILFYSLNSNNFIGKNVIVDAKHKRTTNSAIIRHTHF